MFGLVAMTSKEKYYVDSTKALLQIEEFKEKVSEVTKDCPVITDLETYNTLKDYIETRELILSDNNYEINISELIDTGHTNIAGTFVIGNEKLYRNLMNSITTLITVETDNMDADGGPIELKDFDLINTIEQRKEDRGITYRFKVYDRK